MVAVTSNVGAGHVYHEVHETSSGMIHATVSTPNLTVSWIEMTDGEADALLDALVSLNDDLHAVLQERARRSSLPPESAALDGHQAGSTVDRPTVDPAPQPTRKDPVR